MDGEEFIPQLGKMRGKGAKKGRRYAHRLLAAVNRAGGRSVRKGFTSHPLARGGVMGAILAGRDQFGAFRKRRVIVKVRIVKLAGKGIDRASAHLRYIQRDGVTKEGERGDLYSAEKDKTDGKSFLGRSQKDRHQFRFIVAPEEGVEYGDLKHLTRRLLSQMEEDLGTRLEWVAVDHFNTGNPHTHILVRGKDERGKDLVISPSYISSGIRERAAELVYLDLGPRTDREIETQLRSEVTQQALTSLDKNLLQKETEEGLISPHEKDLHRQTLLTGRLKYLQKLGLAEEVKRGQWGLEANIETTLRRMGERGDIIKTMHRALKEAKLDRSAGGYSIYDPENAKEITGRVIDRGLSDEFNDRHYLVVDGMDGQTHYVDIGRGELTEPTPQGSIVKLEPKDLQPKQVDHTIAEVAEVHNGQYNIDLHLKHDPRASEAFVRTHIRRLEAIRKVMGAPERQPNGTWQITSDHMDHVKEHERGQARRMPVKVRQLSRLTLDQQVGTDGATWLDRQMVAKQPEVLRNAGLGNEIKDATKRRQQWLVKQGLAHKEQGKIIYKANILKRLEQRELARISAKLSKETNLPYLKAKMGERIEGTMRKTIELASSKYALVERSKDFTLVPWRQVLDRHIGKQISGIMRTDGNISWTIGRQRGVGIG